MVPEPGDGVGALPADVVAQALRRVTAALLSAPELGGDEVVIADRLIGLATRLEVLTSVDSSDTPRTPGVVRDSPVTGAKNALSAPLRLGRGSDRSVEGVASFGLAYEGRPGSLHEGVAPVILDVALALAHRLVARPGLTAELVLDFLRPVPLNIELTIRARPTWVSGRQGCARGEILVAEEVCIRAAGRFVTPSAQRGPDDSSC